MHNPLFGIEVCSYALKDLSMHNTKYEQTSIVGFAF
jgi:hypothetical protein